MLRLGNDERETGIGPRNSFPPLYEPVEEWISSYVYVRPPQPCVIILANQHYYKAFI